MVLSNVWKTIVLGTATRWFCEQPEGRSHKKKLIETLEGSLVAQ
ncbi:MAG: hypothetical protein O4861_07555 [Trichodesmium sp. St16_bin4-tuft]|nr:hypothetical protein [Trichodesmium sp. St16_bin4-tuft]MDE5104126.1 hypothetical protein [Trichodesmium sp. St19_bin2]